jgi:hypothetical protein
VEHDTPPEDRDRSTASPPAETPIAATAQTVAETPPAEDAPSAAAPAPDDGGTEPSRDAQPVPWKTVAAGGVIVAAIASELQRQGARAAELDQLLNAHRAAVAAPRAAVPSSPRRADPPPPDRLIPVTSRPKHVNFAWCFGFLYCTAHETRVRLVPSRSSRSQYIRIAKLLYEDWGRELDKRGTRFEVLRWIAAPKAFEGRQARYMEVLRGEPRELRGEPREALPPERPAELKRSWKTPKLPKRLFAAPKCVSVSVMTAVCDPGSLFQCASAPPLPRCRRPDRRCWVPRNPVGCNDVAPAPVSAPVVDAVEAVLRERMGPDFRLPGAALRVPEPDSTGSCLPRPAPCPRRRRRARAPVADASPPRPRGRLHLPGDIDWC